MRPAGSRLEVTAPLYPWKLTLGTHCLLGVFLGKRLDCYTISRDSASRRPPCFVELYNSRRKAGNPAGVAPLTFKMVGTRRRCQAVFLHPCSSAQSRHPPAGTLDQGPDCRLESDGSPTFSYPQPAPGTHSLSL